MVISPDRTTVANAIAAAAQGDTIELNAGNVTWSSPITIDRKAVKIVGAGQGSTNIAVTGNGIFDWYFPDNDYVCEVGHITFNMSGADSGITVGGNDPHYGRPNGFRFHHLTFTNASEKCISINQVMVGSGVTPRWLTSGLIDHCTFYETSGGSNKVITILGTTNSSASVHDAHKVLPYFPFGLGNQYAVYMEDNTFNYVASSDGAYDAYGGARYVFRYNTVNNTRAEHHGADSGGYRGTMQFEIYNNTFTSTVAGQREHDLRSGVGVVFGNTYTGSYTGSYLSNYRSEESMPPFGICNGSSTWDENQSGMGGYACLDQIGHLFTATTGGVNTLYPMYAWNNYKNGSLVSSWTPDGAQGIHISANRDYYNPTASFNGSSGCGWGTLANRPSSGLTAGVGYFATDVGAQGTLYRATGATTWETYYTPYTYPHPLNTDGGTPPTGTIVLAVR